MKDPGLQQATCACSAFLQDQHRRKGTGCCSRHVAAHQTAHQSEPALAVQDECMRADAAATLQTPVSVSTQTLQAVAGGTTWCIPSAWVPHGSFGHSHMKQTETQGLFWRSPCSKCPLPGSVCERSILSSCKGSSACLASALLLSTSAQAPAPSDGRSDSPRLTHMPISCGRALFSTSTPCPVPFLKWQGTLGSRDLTIFWLSLHCL